MNVLYCITRSDTIGGAQVHVADMAAWMIEKGHSAKVVVGGQGAYCDELNRRSIPFRSCRYLQRAIRLRNDLRAIRELRDIFRDESPDLISLHSAKAGILGRLATLRLPARAVFTAHGWSFTEGISRGRAVVYRNLERYLSRLTDRIITVSEFDRQLAIRKRVTTADKIVTVRNAMPDVPIRASVGKRSGPVRVVVVARLDAQKDHATLFAALNLVRELDWHLQLVGDGPLEGKLRALVSDLDLSGKIDFLGLRRDVESILADSDLFVLPSNWEGFPRSILEAMRAGLPVIASDVGGTAESVVDDVTGYLVARGDAGVLSQRLDYLIKRPDERQRLGTEARKRFERYFLFDRMADETLAVYKSVIGDSACGFS